MLRKSLSTPAMAIVRRRKNKNDKTNDATPRERRRSKKRDWCNWAWGQGWIRAHHRAGYVTTIGSMPDAWQEIKSVEEYSKLEYTFSCFIYGQNCLAQLSTLTSTTKDYIHLTKCRDEKSRSVIWQIKPVPCHDTFMVICSYVMFASGFLGLTQVGWFVSLKSVMSGFDVIVGFPWNWVMKLR